MEDAKSGSVSAEFCTLSCHILERISVSVGGRGSPILRVNQMGSGQINLRTLKPFERESMAETGCKISVRWTHPMRDSG